MKPNDPRILLMIRILDADQDTLRRFIAAIDAADRPQIPGNLPEWVPSSEAARLLHLTDRHIRRLAKSHPQSSLLQAGPTGQPTWHLNRNLIFNLATTHRRATRATHAPHNTPITSDAPKMSGLFDSQATDHKTRLRSDTTERSAHRDPTTVLQTTPDIHP